MRIKEALTWASKKIKTSGPLEAEFLLTYLLNTDKVWLYKNQDYFLSTVDYSQYKKLIKRRVKGEPIAYITHWKEFYGLDFYLDKRVFIPRPETEILVEEITNHLQKLNPFNFQISIADIGTGSGCIAITLAKLLPKFAIKRKWKIYATDISKKALEVAKINAKKHKVLTKIKFLHGDLLEPLPEKVDIIVANLPYVDITFLKRSPENCWTLYKEPKIAWDGKRDGLDLIKRLLKEVPAYLNKKSKVFLEIDSNQKKALEKLIPQYFPNSSLRFKRDLANLDRLVIITNSSLL